MLNWLGKVGPNRNGDGQLIGGHRYGWDGELITRDLGGRYFEHLQRGQMFIYNNATAGVAGATLGTSSAPAIINPPGSNKLFIPTKVFFGGISGTVIVAHIGWGYHRAATIVGTGADIVSLTEVDPVAATIGSPAKSSMRFAPTTISWTGAPTWGGTYGLNAGGAEAAGPLFQLTADLADGVIAFAPGWAFVPFCSNAALALVTHVSVVGIEIPYQGL